jgi:hypothetical protein
MTFYTGMIKALSRKVSTPKYAPSTYKAHHISLVTSDFFQISLPNLIIAAPATRDAWLKQACAACERQSRVGNGEYQQERQAIAAWLQIR